MAGGSGLLWTLFGTFTPGHTASQGTEVGTHHLQGRCTLVWERSPVSFVEINPSIPVATPGVSVLT